MLNVQSDHRILLRKPPDVSETQDCPSYCSRRLCCPQCLLAYSLSRHTSDTRRTGTELLILLIFWTLLVTFVPATGTPHTVVSLLNFFRCSGFQSLSFTFLYPVRSAVRSLITGVHEMSLLTIMSRLLGDQCCRKQYLLIRSHA